MEQVGGLLIGNQALGYSRDDAVVGRCCESIDYKGVDLDDLTEQVEVKTRIRRGHRCGCSDSLRCLCGLSVVLASPLTLFSEQYQYN